MKCPYCDCEMIQGYLQSSHGILFAIEPHTVHFWPYKSIGEFIVPSNRRVAPTCTAFHCAECKKIILDYIAR